MANPWDNDPIVQPGRAGPTVTPLPMSPKDQAREGRDISASNRDDTRTGIAVRGEGRDIGYKKFEQVSKWADDYNAEPTVKSYRVAVQELAKALDTGDGPQADLALTYAFAKAMDPESVVREAEQGMVAGSQPWLQASVEKVKKQFGMDGAGSFTPEARAALRSQIINSVEKRARLYDQRRDFYTARAERYDFDPADIVGDHDAAPFVDQFKAYDRGIAQPESGGDIYTVAGPDGKKIEFNVPPGASDDQIRDLGIAATRNPALKGSPVNRPPEGYQGSYMGQGMSGVNEGIGSTLGFPIDVANGVMDLLPRTLNAVANTDLPTSQDMSRPPAFGSDYVRGNMERGGMIYEPSDDPNKQSVRRVGQSVGAALVPAMGAGSLARAGGAMLAGFGGGGGGAAAQRAFPGNAGMEIAGEMLGGLGFGGAAAGAARRSAQREIEAAVPTVPQLKQQAGDLYRSAEARGVTAGPMQTQDLADKFRGTLGDGGQITPLGQLSPVYPKLGAAMKMADDYAGLPMSPTQMQTVRGVAADGMASVDRNERRLAGLLVDDFDTFANPLAPELPQARDIASRYLTAEQLEKARELAASQSSAFTGSGFENALRTQYGVLDRASIKGTKHFSDDVTGAIETVKRGTPGSNFARQVGRFAPTGPVPVGMGAGVGALVGGPVGMVLGGTIGALGTAGRVAATRMGIRNADVAELIARNGGKLPQAQIGGPELEALTAALVAAESAKYLPEKKPKRGLLGSSSGR